jgi:ABC-type amino acid transport substrate-binding protein
MKKHLILPLFLAAMTVMFTQCAKDKLPVNGDPEKFSYLTEEYHPFNYSENGAATGASVEILDSLFARLELKINRTAVSVTDWKTAYDKVLSTPNTMLFSMVRTKANESLFKWVGPIASDDEVAVCLASSGNTVTGATDLNNYFTGAVDKYDNVDKLLNHGVLRANVIIYDNDEELYKALTDNREVQFIFTRKPEHKKAILTLGYATSVFAQPFGIHSESLYYAFNIETADEMISRFQEQLTLFKSQTAPDGSSIYSKILSRYNF